jgi:tetratricopeptide (TPR) repeat protein
VLQITPDDAEYCYELAQLLYTKKGASIKFMRYLVTINYAKLYREAVRLQPKNAEYLEFLGHVLYHHNCGGFHCDSQSLEEAFHYWNKALKVDPNNTKAIFSIVEAATVNGAFKERAKRYGKENTIYNVKIMSEKAISMHDSLVAQLALDPSSNGN